MSLTFLKRAATKNGSSMDWIQCSCGAPKFTVRTALLKAGKARCRNRIHAVQDALTRSGAKTTKEVL